MKFPASLTFSFGTITKENEYYLNTRAYVMWTANQTTMMALKWLNELVLHNGGTMHKRMVHIQGRDSLGVFITALKPEIPKAKTPANLESAKGSFCDSQLNPVCCIFSGNRYCLLTWHKGWEHKRKLEVSRVHVIKDNSLISEGRVFMT